MSSDCQALKLTSLYIKNWLIAQPKVKEESLTDWLLYDFSQKNNKITYKAFSRNEEARKTGADWEWEWWFLFPKFSVRTRIQAKKIKEGDNYPSIAHRNRYGLQIKKLLKDARKHNALAFYAFYMTHDKDVLCSLNIKDEGVFIASGNEIYENFIKNKQKASLENLAKFCVPLSCLLCCPVSPSPNRFIDFLVRYFQLEIMGGSISNSLEDVKNFGIYSQVPYYVNNFLNFKQEALPDWWENEYQDEIGDVNALVIYDSRIDS